MTREIARVLAEIDDPQTIEEILGHVDGTTRVQSSDRQSHRTHLADLYDRFLDRRQNRSPSTRAQYKRTIPEFIEFAEANGATTSADISTELVDSYVDDLNARYDSDATIITYTKNVRAWLRWLGKRDHCTETVYRLLDKDELGLNPKARDEAIPAPEATSILRKLRQQRRGSLMHALLELVWNGGPRLGGVHSLDRRDFDPDENEIRFRHRPETGTRLKNGSEDDPGAGDGERNIEIKQSVVDALECYIEFDRHDVTDDHGREPLFTTQYGRCSQSTLRRRLYRATSCRWAPDGDDEPSCDGTCDPDSDVCPRSYYPHAIRRGAIVHHLSGGLPPHRASERFDVSTDTIEKHYDPRTKRQRKDDRAEDVRDAWDA